MSTMSGGLLIAEIVSVLLSLGFYARINKNIIAPMYSPAE